MQTCCTLYAKEEHVVDVVLAQNTSCTVYAAYQLCQHLQHLQTIAMQKRANEQPPSAHGSCLAALRPSRKYWLVEQISSTDKCSCNKGICMHEHAYIAMQCILRDLDDVWLQCFCCSRYTPHVQLKEFLMGIESWQQPLHPRVMQSEMCSSCSQWYMVSLLVILLRSKL